MERRFLAAIPAICCLLALSAGGAGSVGAQPAEEEAAERELRSIERAVELHRERQRRLRKQERALSREIDSVRRDMVAVAGAIQQREAEATALEAEIAQLAAQEAETAAWLEERRGQLIGIIGALERMAQRPPEALIAMPASPVETLRSALLLRSVVPRLERDARQLREDVAALKAIRSELQAKRESLDAALDDLEAKRADLAALSERKGLLKDRAEAERRDVTARLSRMARQATDLRDLLRRLEAERRAAEAAKRRKAAEAARRRAEEQRRRAAEATRRLNEASRESVMGSEPSPEQAPSAETEPAETEPVVARDVPPPPEPEPPQISPAPAKGSLRLPARGRIVRDFGDGSGPRSHGITIAARPGAQVVAPYEGRIAYAGPFRGYGLLLIIAHGGGYHSLLTGLSRLDSTPGQRVLAGEPVGVMETSGSKDTRLYVELRHNGQPVNPIPWLTARKG